MPVAVIDDAGMARPARFIASPNFDERPAGAVVELLVVHSISLPPGQFGGPGIAQLFTNQLDPQEHPYYQDIASLRVSAHFFVDRNGQCVQFVSCEQRAWHAGASCWAGRERCNDFSIGVELEGCDEVPYTDAQYETLAALTRAIRGRYPISDIVGHADIAPGRKTDPGPCFDWPRYRGLLAQP